MFANLYIHSMVHLTFIYIPLVIKIQIEHSRIMELKYIVIEIGQMVITTCNFFLLNFLRLYKIAQKYLRF